MFSQRQKTFNGVAVSHHLLLGSVGLSWYLDVFGIITPETPCWGRHYHVHVSTCCLALISFVVWFALILHCFCWWNRRIRFLRTTLASLKPDTNSWATTLVMQLLVFSCSSSKPKQDPNGMIATEHTNAFKFQTEEVMANSRPCSNIFCFSLINTQQINRSVYQSFSVGSHQHYPSMVLQVVWNRFGKRLCYIHAHLKKTWSLQRYNQSFQLQKSKVTATVLLGTNFVPLHELTQLGRTAAGGGVPELLSGAKFHEFQFLRAPAATTSEGQRLTWDMWYRGFFGALV